MFLKIPFYKGFSWLKNTELSDTYLTVLAGVDNLWVGVGSKQEMINNSQIGLIGHQGIVLMCVDIVWHFIHKTKPMKCHVNLEKESVTLS